MGTPIATDALKRLFDAIRPRDEPEAPEAFEGTDIIVGLGNPGPRYSNTRHNVGFKIADEIVERLPGGRERSKFDAGIYETNLEGARLIVAKPLTMMNRSGLAVAPIANWYKAPADRLLVIYDDLDLPFGRIRLRSSGGAGGHNGVASVIQQLGTQEFARLRVGIGRPTRGSTVDYVLTPFDDEERSQLPGLVEVAADAALAWRRNGIESVMNEYNQIKDVLARNPERTPGD